MQIKCPNCKTSYQVDPSAVGPTGRSVRCARCRTVWFAVDTTALAEIAVSHRADIAQFAATAAGPDEAVEWPEPYDGAVDGIGDKSVPREAQGAGHDPVDVGLVHNAPPIVTADSPTQEDPLADLAVRSAPNMPVVESPTLAPTEHRPAASSPSQGDDIETVAARRTEKQAQSRRFHVPGWPIVILGLILLDLSLIGWRAEVVRVAPQTASLYAAIGLGVNLRGLALANVTTETQTTDGVQVLLVQGLIVSAATRTVAVPRLRLAVRNVSGNEIYTWTALPTRSLLSPGETLVFQSRLAAPPPGTHDLLVRFFNRHDLGIGIE
jgi:predicted Zn finger-like uncharacterized protein